MSQNPCRTKLVSTGFVSNPDVGVGMVSTTSVYAQDDYEIQVYGAETVESHRTMVELHSNFTIQGSKEVVDGVLPTEHAWHETIEITRGFNSWFETWVLYLYEYSTCRGWDWVGDHIRPRFRIPASWNWPVGISSFRTKLGTSDPSTPQIPGLEIRPIIDRIKAAGISPLILPWNELFSKDGKPIRVLSEPQGCTASLGKLPEASNIVLVL